jgi:hypothetical protein
MTYATSGTANVIPLRRAKPPARHCLVLTATIDPNVTLEERNLVAFCWVNEDVRTATQYSGDGGAPTGRDGNGRFVKKGSPDEC